LRYGKFRGSASGCHDVSGGSAMRVGDCPPTGGDVTGTQSRIQQRLSMPQRAGCGKISARVGSARYRRHMRWENLFDDLAGQLEHELDAEQIDLRGEEERLRIGRLTVRDPLVTLHESAAGAHYRVRVQLDMGHSWASHPAPSGG